MSSRFFAIIALSTALTACATNGELAPTPEEAALATQLQDRSIVPATQEERAVIANQDLLTQAAFWAEAYELNPGDREAALNLSTVLRQLNNGERAAEVARQALALYPDDSELQIAFGYALTAAGRGAQAIEPLSRATGQSPDNWQLANALGVAYEQAGRADAARRQFQDALVMSAGSAAPLNNLALSYMLGGEPEEAESLLRRAVDRNTATPEVRQNLALALALQGRFNEAEAMSLIDATPEMTQANLDYVRALMSTGRRYDRTYSFQEPSR